MKKIIFVFLLLSNLPSFAQTTSTSLTMDGIGDIKVNMSKAALEKITKKTITVRPVRQNEWLLDTVRLVHKEIAYDIILSLGTDENNKSAIKVYEIKSTSPLVKTKSGITIGDDKLKIVSTYEGYSMSIQPLYEGEEFAIKSKTKSILVLHSEETNNAITFYLENNKVIAMSVGVFEGC